GRGFAEVHSAATAVDGCAGVCRSRLFPLRTGAGRRWSAAGETARCAEHPALARERDDGGEGSGEGRLVLGQDRLLPANLAIFALFGGRTPVLCRFSRGYLTGNRIKSV